jgi:hypothetical protein
LSETNIWMQLWMRRPTLRIKTRSSTISVRYSALCR